MRLGYNTGYWSSGPPKGVAEVIAECDRLGFEHIWTAEAYGSDALTPLAWWGAATENVKLGTAIMQMAARTPAATAMAAITMDHLSGGRFILGLGASGPQVVEGWYGQPYPKPLARTREYVEIVRSIVARDRVQFEGEYYSMPLTGGTGLGKPLKSTVHPLRDRIPIYLAAEGPKNVALSAEICDGWLPLFFAPRDNKFYRDALESGFAAAGREPWSNFEVACTVSLIPGDDVEACADLLRPMIALYAGGMGAKGQNFHYDVFARMGFEQECERIQEFYLAGHKADAIAAVSTEMVEAISLIGPEAKIRDELQMWEETVIDTMLIAGPIEVVRFAADLVG
ncbi:MAG: LLM class F420-dependent oxidoreductase [Acidimicrobiales bacterium]